MPRRKAVSNRSCGKNPTHPIPSAFDTVQDQIVYTVQGHVWKVDREAQAACGLPAPLEGPIRIMYTVYAILCYVLYMYYTYILYIHTHNIYRRLIRYYSTIYQIYHMYHMLIIRAYIVISIYICIFICKYIYIYTYIYVYIHVFTAVAIAMASISDHSTAAERCRKRQREPDAAGVQQDIRTMFYYVLPRYMVQCK